MFKLWPRTTPLLGQLFPTLGFADDDGGSGGNDWRESIPDDVVVPGKDESGNAVSIKLREHPSVGKFKNVGDMAKSYVEMEKYRGNSVVIPTKDSKPEEVESFWQKIGVPEKPDGYQLKAPDKLHERVKITPEFESGFKAMLREARVPQAQAGAIYQKFLGQLSAQEAQADARRTEAFQNAQTDLKSRWGNEYDQNVKIAEEVAEKMLTPEMAEQIRNKPEWIEHYFKIGKALSEDTLKNFNQGAPKGGDSTVASAKKELAQMNEDFLARKGPLYEENHPKHHEAVKRRQELYAIIGDK